MHYSHAGEPWNAPQSGMDQLSAAAASGSVSFGRSMPRRHHNVNGAALAAQIAGSGCPNSREARPNQMPSNASDAMPPWRGVSGAQRGMQASRQHPQGYPAPLAEEIPNPGSWTLGAKASGHQRPYNLSGQLAAAVADDPPDSSSGEEDDDERCAGSDVAVMGSQACPTIGSRGHSLRMCKPCAFVMKGCQSGQNCKFCHLCEVGEKKRRKKEKVAIRRELQRWRQPPIRQAHQHALSAPTTPTNGGTWRTEGLGFW